MSQPEAHQLSLGPLTGVAFGPDRTRMFKLLLRGSLLIPYRGRCLT